MSDRIIPTAVRSFAVEHRVPLDRVGCDVTPGVMTFMDIHHWAMAAGKTELAMTALGAQLEDNAKPIDRTRPAAVQRGARGTVSRLDVERAPLNAMARNPLVDRVRTAAAATNMPAPAGAAPTLFAGGDLPSFTASGIPPAALLEVPWQARHAMASAPTAAEAYAIRSACSGPDAADTARSYADDPGNEDYADRVERWRIASMSDEQLRMTNDGTARDELARREAALPGLSGDDEAIIGALASGNYSSHNGREVGQWSNPARSQ